MVKEPHFTPQKMLSMLELKAGSLGPYALIPGPKERSQMLLGKMQNPTKNFSFLDYEMYTGTIDGKRVTVGNGGRFAPDTGMTTEILCAAGIRETFHGLRLRTRSFQGVAPRCCTLASGTGRR